jgi:hypothetical protein
MWLFLSERLRNGKSAGELGVGFESFLVNFLSQFRNVATVMVVNSENYAINSEYKYQANEH